MQNQSKHAMWMGALVMLLLVGATPYGSQAFGQTAPVEEIILLPDDRPPEPQEYFDKRLLAAAKEAYEVALEQLKAERITDAEVLYRWSLRWMKAEQAAGTDPVAAAKGHLRRMEPELTHVLDQQLKRRKATEEASKYLLTSTRFYIYEAKEIVKAAEQTKLVKSAASPDDVASPSPDAAVKAAETYLGAVLEGNYDEAAELAVPGSLATSKRLMDSIKGLISGKSISVFAIQTSGRQTAVLMQEAQSADNIPESRERTQFTVALEPKGGRWFVTNVAMHKPLPRTAPSRPSQLSQSHPEDASDTAPKETKVIVLRYAKAADLQQTISHLLELKGPDFRVAGDARTNRLLLHGTPERLKEVIELIRELDVPSTVKEALPSTEDPADPVVPGTTRATDPRPTQN